MTHPVTAQEMKSYDTYTIEKLGVPSMVLMEHAALATVEVLFDAPYHIVPESKDSSGNVFDLKKVLCVCGAGNNGGDGFAAARLLFLKGIDVEVLFVGNRDKCSDETSQQYFICENYGLTIHDNDLSIVSSGGYTTIVDAVFGIGLDREVAGKFADLIFGINEQTEYGSARILACDIPSGLNADTGEVMGVAVKADSTVTYAYNKIGMTVGRGPECAGKVVVKDIGIYAPEDM